MRREEATSGLLPRSWIFDFFVRLNIRPHDRVFLATSELRTDIRVEHFPLKIQSSPQYGRHSYITPFLLRDAFLSV